MEPDEKTIVGLLAVDLDKYFECLVVMYYHEIFSLAFRSVRNHHDAEDIVWETFERACAALRRFSVQRILTLHLRAWLRTIARNACSNFATRRRQPPSVALDPLEDESLLEIEDTIFEQPESALEAGELRRRLESAVENLPQGYRIIVRLYYFEDLSYHEIANLLHMKDGTVKVRLLRAALVLRRTLQKMD